MNSKSIFMISALALVPAWDAGQSFAYAQDAEELPPISVERNRGRAIPRTTEINRDQIAAPVNPAIVAAEGPVGGSVRSAMDARYNAPNAVVVIDGAQLQQFNDQTIGDALRRLPGVTFPGVNRSREIKLRGLPGEYTQVFLDGRPLVDADTSRSNMEVDRIPVSLIERVEIIRSPLVNYPSSGAAGTVNIITKRNFKKTGGAGITIGGGHVDSFNNPGELSGWAGAEAGKLKFFVGGGYQRRFLEESINTFYPYGAAANNGKTLQDQKRSFDEWTFLSRFEYKANDVHSFLWSPTYMKTEELRAQTDWRYNAASPYALNRTQEETRNRMRENIGNLFEWKQDFGNLNGRIFFDVQQAKEETWRRPLTNGVPGAVTVNPIDLMRYAPGAAYTATIGSHTVDFGGGLNQLSRDEKDTTRGDRFYKIKENIYYGYLSDAFTVFGRDLLTAGVRMEHTILDTTDVNGMTRSMTATDWNPSLQYRLSITDDLNFRAGLARTLRRPDLRDLSPVLRANGGTYANPDTRGNPELSPERIWGLDVGFDWYLFDRLGLLAVNFFDRKFDSKIERSLRMEGARWVSTPRNLGDGEAYGVELEGRLPLKFLNMPHLTLWANLTNVHSRVTDPLTNQTRRFAEQPDLLTNVGLDYYVEAWKTTFGINWNRVYSYSQNILQVAGVGLNQNVYTDFNTLDKLDLSVKMAVNKNFNLTFSANNVLRPVDRRNVLTYTPAGALSSHQLTEQASHSTYYVRANFVW